MKRMKILIDCDTGVDDSLAVLYALKKPEFEILGFTTGFGNTSAPQAAENTLRLLKLAGREGEIPVSIGENAPLKGKWDGPVVHVHGSNGISGVELPPSRQEPVEERACDFIVRLARENPGELTLITLGRMTNVARALEKEPNLPKLVRGLVAMGGTYHAPGNVSPVAEANIAGDPEAADRVLMAGFDTTIVGLDVTTKIHLTSKTFADLREYCAPENRAIADYLVQAFIPYRAFSRSSDGNLDACPMHDPLALLVAIDPSVVTMRRLPARVECGEGLCRGMIVTDGRAQPMEAPFANICVDVNEEQAINRLFRVFL